LALGDENLNHKHLGSERDNGEIKLSEGRLINKGEIKVKIMTIFSPPKNLDFDRARSFLINI
jgi:hypothetical protein